MKSAEVLRANCEKNFVTNALQNRVRLDGRKFSDYRKVKISFGCSFGHCEVCIGSTRAIAQVSCEVVKPTQNRPNEGQLFFNVDLSPMASPAFEIGRSSDKAVEINRFVERCLKESKPVDVESLCIVAGEKVWCLRVDIQILDDKGNILDCACIAAVTALAHFRRPDVTVIGKDVTVHSFDDRSPVPLNVHHIPVCITLGFISPCNNPIVDATDIEEVVLDGSMTVALNSHMEICCAKMCGVCISPEQIMMCCKIASAKVQEITDKINSSLEEEKKKRFPDKDPRSKWKVGDDFSNSVLKSVAQPTPIDVTESIKKGVENSRRVDSNLPTNAPVKTKGKATAMTIGDGGSNVWIISDDESLDDNEGDKEEYTDSRANEKQISSTSNKSDHQKMEVVDLEDGSEEEETVQLTSMELDFQVEKPSHEKEKLVDQDIKIIEETTESRTSEIKTKKRRKKKKAILIS